MKPPPQSPALLKDAIAAIFPALPREVGASGESVFEDAGPTYHSLLREFAYFFAKNVDQFSDRQLRRCADLIARSTAVPGPLADAMETCLLAQLRQQKADGRLAPFLAAAKEAARD
jgi:hypothetical protein